MSPRTVVFVVGPSRFRASGVSTPCIFRIFLSSADSLRMSPRIRRISVVLSEHRVSVVRSAGVPENRSGRSIPTVFTAPLGSSPGSRVLPPGPFGSRPLLADSRVAALYRPGSFSAPSASGPFRGIPAPFFRPFAAARSPYLCGTAAPFSRLHSVPMRNTPRSLRRSCYPVRNPHVRGSSESCRDEPCGRGTTPRCVLP